MNHTVMNASGTYIREGRQLCEANILMSTNDGFLDGKKDSILKGTGAKLVCVQKCARFAEVGLVTAMKGVVGVA
jgi:hypothetical protein